MTYQYGTVLPKSFPPTPDLIHSTILNLTYNLSCIANIHALHIANGLLTLLMGPASTVDWNLAKALRGQGFRWEEIAPQVNANPATLKVRASREGWSRLKKQTANALEAIGIQTAAQTIKEQAPKLAEKWLETVQANTVKAADAFDKLPIPKNLDDFKTYEETADKHVKRGRAAFGLDDQKSGGVQINIMSQLAQIAMTANTATEISGGVAHGLAVDCPNECPNPSDNE